jgi:protocatechuate 3,4-dioxygenase beta subunit
MTSSMSPGTEGSAMGNTTRITGRILDPNGQPISGARVEFWRFDANERYHYVWDDGGDRPRDVDFQVCSAATARSWGISLTQKNQASPHQRKLECRWPSGSRPSALR